MESQQQAVPVIVHTVRRLFPRDVAIAVADRSRFVYYQPGPAVDLKIKPGDEIKEGSVTMRALKGHRPVAMFVGEDLYGIPYYGVSAPLEQFDQGEGCLTVILPSGAIPQGKPWNRPEMLVGKGADRWVPIPYEEIDFIESKQGKTVLHARGEQFVNRHTLAELEMVLPRERFQRVHKAFIVNVERIAEICPDFHSTFMLVMQDRDRSLVPVSQKYASRFRKWMGF